MPKYFYICSECKVKKSIYHSMTEASVKTGQVVKESIEEFREDLKNQKDELRSEYSEKNE